jgi:hypothetical protein
MQFRPDQLVTVSQAAEIAGMSRWAFDKTWRHTEWVRVVRLAGRPLVVREDAERIRAFRIKRGRFKSDEGAL